MELIVKIEAPGLMEALLAIAEELKVSNARPITGILESTLDYTPALDPGSQISTGSVTPGTIQGDSGVLQQQAPIANQAPPIQQAPIPTTAAPSYTQEDMAMACVQLMELKGQPKIMEVMAGFGVQALTQLDKARYNDLAQILRAEGVNI